MARYRIRPDTVCMNYRDNVVERYGIDLGVAVGEVYESAGGTFPDSDGDIQLRARDGGTFYANLSTLDMIGSDGESIDRDTLDGFKNLVRTRILEEAAERGWCGEAEDFLNSLGIYTESVEYNEGTVAAFANGTFAIRGPGEVSEDVWTLYRGTDWAVFPNGKRYVSDRYIAMLSDSPRILNDQR